MVRGMAMIVVVVVAACISVWMTDGESTRYLNHLAMVIFFGAFSFGVFWIAWNPPPRRHQWNPDPHFYLYLPSLSFPLLTATSPSTRFGRQTNCGLEERTRMPISGWQAASIFSIRFWPRSSQVAIVEHVQTFQSPS